MKKTVLIIGISSFVGSNLAKVISEKYQVVGTYFKEAPHSLQNFQMMQMDVLNREEVKKAIHFFKPDYVVYCVGVSSLTEAKKQSRKAEELTSKGVGNCLSVAERAGAMFIYLSSAFVLGGEDRLYKESDTPLPITTYGSITSNAEFLIQRTSHNYLILRCPVLYGLGYSTERINIYELIQKSIFEQEKLKLDDSVVVGFLDVELIARFLMVLLDKSIVNRLLNISSKDHLTCFKFAQLYAETFGYSTQNFEPTSGKFPSEQLSKRNNLCFKMDVTNTETRVGIKMPTIKESLLFTKQRFSAKSS